MKRVPAWCRIVPVDYLRRTQDRVSGRWTDDEGAIGPPWTRAVSVPASSWCILP